MCELREFLKANPVSRTLRPLREPERAGLAACRLPPEVADFLKTYGLSTFHAGFFGTTLPEWHFDTLSEWGLKGRECFAFLKTALGGLFYYRKGKIYRLNPFTGNAVKSDLSFGAYMNLLLTMDAILEACYLDVYQARITDDLLQYDEIYALVPALPLGGSLETSRLETVKMREHLALLAQLYNNKARVI